MSMFIISPSESLLIGLCLEEYLQARDDYPLTSFLRLVPERLRPFVPSMQVVERPVAEEDLPADIEWRELLGEASGFCPSSRETFCRKDSGKIVHVSRDRSRKSLIDLLVHLVYDHVGKSPLDKLVFPP